MTSKRTLFPLAVMEKVLKNIQSDIRVSDNSKIAFEKVIRDYAENIGKIAIEAAKHAGRKTVKEADIELAIKK